MPTVAPRWETLACDEAAAATLAAELAISPVVARLLCQRGFGDPDTAARFLNPSLDHLHDPLALADMGRAVERVLAAIERRERIAIHGDYDVDGVTSTVILRRALELFGADVIHFIPERLRDGYGLQPASVERLHAQGVALIISVDCGIRGADAARRALELGVDLIITDHHEPDAELPAAYAVINPKRFDCSYPDKYLAGVGVALKLVQALCRRMNRESWLPGFIKLAAIGTLADVVPLVGENRVIAKLGLDLLSRGPHKVGLRALLEVAGLTGKTIDSYHIGFMLAPRVNAAGRMSTPDLAARLLLANDEGMASEVRALAQQLDGVEEGIQGRILGGDGIGHDEHPTWAEDAEGLREGAGEVGVVVGADTARDDINRGIFERQPLDVADPELYVLEAALGGERRGHLDHLRGDVEADDAGGVARAGEGGVSGARAHVDDELLSREARCFDDHGQVRAVRMVRERGIRPGDGAELLTDLVGGCAHWGLPAVRWCG